VKASASRRPGVRFGQFELDLFEERLLKKGLPVRIENQPLQILAALVDRPGEMVSREELRASLWPDGTYVDFDESLNTAVKKLRYALGDSADRPVFIETVPRRGYRFIAPVQIDPVTTDEDSSEQLEPASPGNGNGPRSSMESRTESVIPPTAGSKPKWTSIWLIGFGVVFLGICGLLYGLTFSPSIRITQVTRLTNSGRADPWGRLASDGSRLFFLEREADHWNDVQVSVAGGESIPFGPASRNIRIHDLFPDQLEILFSPFTLRNEDLPLWSMPLIGGLPRRVGEILANGAAYSPDGTRIAFANSGGVFVANRDGSDVRQLAKVPECWDVAWSPDGKILRFNAHGPRLWQVSSTGQNLHPFLPSWTAWDGHWTPDGSYYIFSATKNGRDDLWALRESPALSLLQSAPIQLTSAPINFGYSLLSRDGHTIYVYGGLAEMFDVVSFDPASHQFKSVLPRSNVKELSYSPDHQWVLYNDWSQLWRSRPDGSDRLRLAGAPAFPGVHFARWSPDSKQILFDNIVGDKAQSYLMSVDGGTPQQLLPSDLPGSAPAWSPDGQTISFTVLHEAGDNSSAKPGVYFFDRAQGRSTRVAGSEGLAGTAWSPDGRFLAASSEDSTTMKVLDLRTRHWSEVGHGKSIPFPVWSPDSALYFQDLLEPGEPVYRVEPGVSGPQRLYSFEDILQGDAGAIRCRFEGFAPDGSLLVQVSLGGGDVYALTVGHH
jgi:DNA-binding winged helix-turn-helix (wHTH) protein/Tol biopolymer transport system component